MEKLLDRHGIRQSAPHPFQPLSERTIEIETGDRSLRASRIPLLPCPAHVVHVPSSLTSSEARSKQTSAVRTRQQVLKQGLYFDVRPSNCPTESELPVHLNPQLPRNDRFVLARIDSALVRDVSPVQHIRQQQLQSGHAQRLPAVLLPSFTRPLLRHPVSCVHGPQCFRHRGYSGASIERPA